eukprot:13771549-Alexandrium_andersonii.AAC.1
MAATLHLKPPKTKLRNSIGSRREHRVWGHARPPRGCTGALTGGVQPSGGRFNLLPLPPWPRQERATALARKPERLQKATENNFTEQLQT